MEATKETAKSGPAAEGKPARDERARARTYLDLWERHLVHAAVHGPGPGGERAPA